MTLKFTCICVGFSIVVFIFSVVNSSRIARENTTPDLNKISNNISGVQHLLKTVLKSFKDLKKIAKTDSVETDDETDSENKENINTNTNNKGKVDSKINKKTKAFKGTPLYFSDRSSENASGSEEQETIDVTKTSDNSRITAKVLKNSKATPAKQSTDLGLQNQMNARTSDEENETNEDVVSSNEKLRVDSQSKGKPRKVILNNFDIHVKGKAKSEVKSRASTVKEKYLSLPDSEISKPKKEIDNSQSQQDIEMESEVSRAGYLRQAYDDACKQVVIRKCYRALRSVSKDVCSRGKKCSSTYKDDFRRNGQTACDQEFNNQTSACRMGVELNEAAAVSLEFKRLRATDITDQKTSNTSDIQEVNILRDRFEKICKKNSFDKCQAACKHASDKTCKMHECVKAKTKALNRCCKRRCQQVFNYSGGSDESESDDDSDDDDDDDDEKDKDD